MGRNAQRDASPRGEAITVVSYSSESLTVASSRSSSLKEVRGDRSLHRGQKEQRSQQIWPQDGQMMKVTTSGSSKGTV